MYTFFTPPAVIESVSFKFSKVALNPLSLLSTFVWFVSSPFLYNLTVTDTLPKFSFDIPFHSLVTVTLVVAGIKGVQPWTFSFEIVNPSFEFPVTFELYHESPILTWFLLSSPVSFMVYS